VTTKITITNEAGSPRPVKILRWNPTLEPGAPDGESVLVGNLLPGSSITDHVWRDGDIIIREIEDKS
jgi:hypothetical protein